MLYIVYIAFEIYFQKLLTIIEKVYISYKKIIPDNSYSVM